MIGTILENFWAICDKLDAIIECGIMALVLLWIVSIFVK